jgi:hypothetical protein
MNILSITVRLCRRSRLLLRLSAAALLATATATATSALPLRNAPVPGTSPGFELPHFDFGRSHSSMPDKGVPAPLQRTSPPALQPRSGSVAALLIDDDYYGIDVLASTGADGFLGMGPAASINSRGQVAFVGRTEAGEGLFVTDGVNGLQTLTEGFFDSRRVWGIACQINDDREVVGRDRFTGAPPPTFIRRWNVAGQSGPLRVERGGTPEDLYDAVNSHPSTNNFGNVTYSALADTAAVLAYASSFGARSELRFPVSDALRPMISDRDTIVVRTGVSGSRNIWVFDDTLSLAGGDVVASQSDYLDVGQSPGISDDGVAVAYFGNIGAAAAARIETFAGPGIFVSSPGILLDGFRTLRVDRPLDDARAVSYFSSFDEGSRVGVIRQSLGEPGLEGDTLIVSFVATPTEEAQSAWPGVEFLSKTLWTVRIDFGVNNGRGHIPTIGTPTVVAQVGGLIDGRVISDLAVFDPLSRALVNADGEARTEAAGDHLVSFWARTGEGLDLIVKAEHFEVSRDNVQFAAVDFTAVEDAGTAVVTLRRIGGGAGSASVQLRTDSIDGGATAGIDYAPRTSIVRWADNDLDDKTVLVEVLADEEDEPDEALSLLLDPVSGAVVGTPATARLLILDDDDPPKGELRLQAVAIDVAERERGLIVSVSREAGTFGPASVDLELVDGTARSPDDYTARTSTLNWKDGEGGPRFVFIGVEDDDNDEPDETVNLRLVAASGARLGSPSTAVLTIVDDDEPRGRIQFAASSYTAGETAGTAVIALTRTDGSAGSASVRLSTSNSSATAGSDYIARSEVVTWADGDPDPKTVTVSIISDDTDEPDEVVDLSLDSVTGGSLGSPSNTKLFILDDDDPPAGSVQLTSMTYEVSEAGISADITLTRSGGDFGAASVRVSTRDGSATVGDDYRAISELASWADGQDGVRVISIPILQDTLDEPVQTVTILLSEATGAALGSPSMAELSIGDDDDPPAGTIQFSASSYRVAESAGVATLTLSREGGSFGDVSVNLRNAFGGTAMEGVDFVAPFDSALWRDGDTTPKTVSFTVRPDAIDEPDETVNLMLVSVLGSMLGVPSTAVLTIVDDDNPPTGSLRLSATTYTVSEAGGSAVISVTRTGGSFGAASVQVSTSNGTAAAGADYTAISQLVSWSDGDAASKTVSVPISQDLVDEPNESLNLTLSAAAGATLGAPSSAVLTIIDDDEPAPALPILALTLTPTTIAEGGGTAIVRLRLSRPTTVAVRARITYDSRARKPRDLSRAPTYATIRAGQTETSFEVRAANDRRIEPDEQVVLTVREASNATVGAGTAVLTILDND